MRRRLTLICLLLIATTTGFADDRATELKKIQERLERERQSLEELRSRKTSILDVLEGLDRRLSDLGKEERRLEEELAANRREMAATVRHFEEKKAATRQVRMAANERLVNLYKLGELGPLKILFSVDSFTDLVRRSYQLELLVNRDLEVIALYEKRLLELEKISEDLLAKETQLAATQAQIAASHEKLTRERGRKKSVVSAIENEEGIHQRYVAELEVASEQLESLIRKLERTAKTKTDTTPEVSPGTQGFASRKGTLKPPVGGKVVRKYGKYQDPKFFTYQFNKGIQIAAKPSASVRAVYDGTVAYSGWFKGFGQIIIVDHGGGYHTLSANNQEIVKNVGEGVQEGDTLALLSSVQELEPPQKKAPLYFEVRESGKSVDPLEWLAKSDLLVD